MYNICICMCITIYLSWNGEEPEPVITRRRGIIAPERDNRGHAGHTSHGDGEADDTGAHYESELLRKKRAERVRGWN